MSNRVTDEARSLDRSEQGHLSSLPWGESGEEAMTTAPGLIDNIYILKEKLGEGGMGVVYRAVNRLTGQEVALKRFRRASTHAEPRVHPELTTLPAEPPKPESKAHTRISLAYEFQTLASIHHPNIVTVLDYGFDNNQEPFFTMELLESPQSFLDAARNRPLAESVGLLGQLLQALAYLHRRSILHLDVKPSNVLVVDGCVKLVDFGIAGSIGRAARLAGTVDYMAPELLLGREATAGSDLYAVGIIAFQLFTGHHPYSSQSYTSFINSVLGIDEEQTLAPDLMQMLQYRAFSARAMAPASIDEALEQAGDDVKCLARVIKRLLSHSQEERYTDARQVISDLGEAIGQALPSETITTRECFLQAAEFVGRKQEMAQLMGALERAQSGSGSVWMIAGESGVGKSRLLSELRTRALVNSALVLRGHGVTERGANYEVWREVVRHLSLGSELDEREIGILQDIAPDLGALLERVPVPPPKQSPQAAQTRLHATVLALLCRQRRPILIILEDLQWAGTESLELLGYLSPRLAQSLVMIVGSYRLEEENEHLRRISGSSSLRLERLSKADIATLSGAILGLAGAQPALVEYLQQQTEGNLFFLVEAVRALAESAGHLDAINRMALPEQLLTGGMERIIERRLELIPPDGQKLLELAAVSGRRLDLKVLQRAGGVHELNDWLLVCANAAVLELEQGVWQFSHDKIRERLLMKLSQERARALHRRVAETIAVVHAGDVAWAAVLALHWKKAAVPDEAYKHYLVAATEAVRLHAVVEARAHYAAAIEMLEQMPETASTRRSQIDVLITLSSLALWADPLQRNLERMDRASVLLEHLKAKGVYEAADMVRAAKVPYWRGRGSFVNGMYVQAIHFYSQARELALSTKETALYANCSAMIGQTLLMQGHMRACCPFLDEALAHLTPQSPASDWARIIGYQGLSLVARGQVQPGLKRVHDALETARDPTYIATCCHYLAMAYVFIKDWAALTSICQRALLLARQTRDEILTCTSLWLSAWGEAWLNQSADSARSMAQAAAILGAHDSIIIYDWILVASADVALLNGRSAEAIELSRRAIAVARQMGAIFGEGLAHKTLARALLTQPQPDLDQAAAHLAESEALFTRGEAWLERSFTYLLWAELQIANRAWESAREHIERALEILEPAELSRAIDHARQLLERIERRQPA